MGLAGLLLLLAAPQHIYASSWEVRSAYHCSTGNGARDLESPPGSSYKDDISVTECEAACTALADCDAVQYLSASGGNSCYRLADVTLGNCSVGDPHWTVFLRPVVNWESHSAYHCSAGHGARDLESPPGSSYKDDISLKECEAACMALPDCDAVQYLGASGGTSCYRLADVTLANCEVGDPHWSTFIRPDTAGFVPHLGYNCSQEHGARDLESPAGSHFGNNTISVAECEAGCSALAGCTAVRFLLANGGTQCYRLADVNLSECLVGDSHWNTYIRPASIQSFLI